MTISGPTQVSGLLVVRWIGADKDSDGHSYYPKEAACLGSLCYGGIDRMPWFELDEAFYRGTLPGDISRLRASLTEANEDLTGIRLCQDLRTALALLEYSNRSETKNELIALRSDKLARVKGAMKLDNSLCTWLGYDVVSLGNWSLLRDGLFRSPASFPGWEKMINESGLLIDPELSESIIELYEAASRAGQVEELPGSLYGIDVIEVGKVMKQ